MALKSTKTKTVSRPKPTKVARLNVAPHVKTMSNGKPRPKKRGK